MTDHLKLFSRGAKRIKNANEYQKPTRLMQYRQENNIYIMDILEEKEKGTENVFKEILENLPNMGRKMDMQIYKSRRITNRLNSKCAILKYILVKLSKFKHKENLKAARDK